nr:hypothetical protein SHINE37_70300 [Rhizobiaceae bacterium]
MAALVETIGAGNGAENARPWLRPYGSPPSRTAAFAPAPDADPDEWRRGRRDELSAMPNCRNKRFHLC